jgi:hypothetical protein
MKRLLGLLTLIASIAPVTGAEPPVGAPAWGVWYIWENDGLKANGAPSNLDQYWDSSLVEAQADQPGKVGAGGNSVHLKRHRLGNDSGRHRLNQSPHHFLRLESFPVRPDAVEAFHLVIATGSGDGAVAGLDLGQPARRRDLNRPAAHYAKIAVDFGVNGDLALLVNNDNRAGGVNRIPLEMAKGANTRAFEYVWVEWRFTRHRSDELLVDAVVRGLKEAAQLEELLKMGRAEAPVLARTAAPVLSNGTLRNLRPVLSADDTFLGLGKRWGFTALRLDARRESTAEAKPLVAGPKSAVAPTTWLKFDANGVTYNGSATNLHSFADSYRSANSEDAGELDESNNRYELKLQQQRNAGGSAPHGVENNTAEGYDPVNSEDVGFHYARFEDFPVVTENGKTNYAHVVVRKESNSAFGGVFYAGIDLGANHLTRNDEGDMPAYQHAKLAVSLNTKNVGGQYKEEVSKLWVNDNTPGNASYLSFSSHDAVTNTFIILQFKIVQSSSSAVVSCEAFTCNAWSDVTDAGEWEPWTSTTTTTVSGAPSSNFRLFFSAYRVPNDVERNNGVYAVGLSNPP